MRHIISATAVAISILWPSTTFGQSGSQNLSITNYKLVAQSPQSLTKWYFTYTADVVNTGQALASVTATLTSLNKNLFTVVVGKDKLTFSPVPANAHVTSSNTFTILVDRTAPPDPTFSTFQWAFATSEVLPPIANAGPDQVAKVGSTVTLNGGGSSNPSGLGTLTYSWAFTSRPNGSAATLSNPTSVTPSFVVDLAGDYVVALTVTSGSGTGVASVTVSTNGVAPVANAGPDQTLSAGATVHLSGSNSTDANGNPLTYKWSFVSTPTGSTATLTGATTPTPTFIADKVGTYKVQLIVNNGFKDSAPSFVTITSSNVAPVANAGPNQKVNVGDLVQLNGSGSTDADGNPLTYKWSLITVPAGSHAALSSTTIVNPTFTADVSGTYVAQLIVNDGTVDSAPATVMISTNTLPPVADAGLDQTVAHNTTVTLHGSGTDPQGLTLTFQWSLLSKPASSTATLSSTSIASPTFFADKVGDYVAQLIVNNGVLSSAPKTVKITTTNTAPVANAGPNQNVQVGATVTLDGTGSTDADHDPLTYVWTFTSKPGGSTATLTGANSASPMFAADVAGTYVVQLIVNDGSTNSNPATVTISATAIPTITLTPNPLTITTNGSGTLTVTLSAPATGGAQIINLKSNDTGIATVPATVTVPQNSTGANVSVSSVAIGSTTITASANNFVSGTATVNVVAPLSITTTSLPNGIQNVAYSATVAATGGTGALTWSAANLPANLTINASTGVISGTPAAAATTNNIVVSVTDSGVPAQQASKTFSLTIAPTLTITTTVLPNGSQNNPYTATVNATGGTGALTWSATNLPANLTIDPATGVISGTPTTTGTTNNIVVTAKDSGTPTPQTATQTLSLTIVQGLTITSASPLPNGIQNTAYTTTIAASGGTGALAWSATNLPANLSIDPASGVISGTPTTAGTTNNIVVTVKDSGTPTPQTATKTFSLTIAQTLSINTASPLPNGVANAAYSTTIAATGGTGTLTWSAANLPANLTINSATGVISGVPAAAGTTNNIAVTVKDSGTPTPQSVTKTFSLTIQPALVITTASLPAGAVSSPYTTQVAATGGSGTLTWSATGLPAALGIDPATGIISGIPAAQGTSSVVVTVQDSGTPKQTANATLSIVIGPPAGIPVTISALSVGQMLLAPVGLSITPQATDTTFTLTSSDPTKVLLFGATTAGGQATVAASVLVTIPAGISSVSVNAIGVALGQTTLVATNGGTGQGTATVTPSGFIMFGPGGANTITLNQNQTATLTVAVAQLDNAGNVLTTQQPIAPAITLGSTVSISVTISSTSSTVGTATTPVTFHSGDTSLTTTFTAKNTGSNSQASTTVAAVAPANFATPGNNANQVTAFVNAVGCTLPAITVGRNLETSIAADNSGVHVSLSGAVSSSSTCTINNLSQAGLCVTVTSTDPTKFLLSPDGLTAPTASITVLAPANSTRTGDFFVVGVGSGAIGSAQISASAGSFGSCSNSVALAQSGFVISASAFGLVSTFQTGVNQASGLTVYPAALDSSLNVAALQSVAAGSTVNVNVSSSDTSVGTVTSPVTFTGGQSTGSATFTSLNKQGSTDVTVATPATPAGFSTPAQNTKVTANVRSVVMSICGDPAYIQRNGVPQVGYHLQTPCAVSLSQPAQGDLVVTLASSNTNQLLLTTDPTVVGSQSVTVTIPSGTTSSGLYYLQGLACPVVDPTKPTCAGANSATANYTATATNFSDTGTVRVTPSAVVLNGFNSSLFVSKAGGPVPVSVQLWQLDPLYDTTTNTFVTPGFLAAIPGSTTLQLSLNSSNTGVGTITSPTFLPGLGTDNQLINATFTPVNTGSTTITLATPTNFATGFFNGQSFQTVSAIVNP